MDLQTIRRLYNACDPLEPLPPDDVRNVDLDSEIYGRPRGEAWVERLARDFELSDKPVTKLFTGLPGAGKSTELRRLLRRLESPSQAHLLTVMIDAEQRLDLASTIDVPEVVAAVLDSVERRVLEVEGQDPDNTAGNRLMDRMWDWIRSLDPTLEKMELGIRGSKLVVSLKTNPVFRQQVRRLVTQQLTDFRSRAKDALAELHGRAQTQGWAGILVCLDSLEKLRGMSTNWEEVITSAERLFHSGAEDLRALGVHAIYTVPVTLVSRQSGIELMPAVKVRDRDGGVSSDGVLAMRDIVLQRVPSDEDREALLGPARAQDDLIEQMILQSGGYLRDLIKQLRFAIAEPRHPVSAARLTRWFTEQTDAFRELVTRADFKWLARLSQEKWNTLADTSQREIADRMLANSVVLRYDNDRDWYDLHPAAKAIPGVQDALTQGVED
ncbi:MAG: hypothetical protein IAG13_00950 [Deltaproteobacteria bacterium]|nr:hypothetical protein [Nannocystaceae bacterium]